MTTVIDPLTPNPLEEFSPIFGELLPTATRVADCDCQHHKLEHTYPGECGKTAEYRLSGQVLLSPVNPIVYFLCGDCVQWHRNWLTLTHPTIEIAVTPL